MGNLGNKLRQILIDYSDDVGAGTDEYVTKLIQVFADTYGKKITGDIDGVSVVEAEGFDDIRKLEWKKGRK